MKSSKSNGRGNGRQATSNRGGAKLFSRGSTNQDGGRMPQKEPAKGQGGGWKKFEGTNGAVNGSKMKEMKHLRGGTVE